MPNACVHARRFGTPARSPFYMDSLVIRPALLEMAQRMADGGYVVVLPAATDRHWHELFGLFRAELGTDSEI